MQNLLLCVVSRLYMLHELNVSLARRDKLKKLFSYVEILIKTHELSTIHKYLSVISGSRVEKQKNQWNEGKKYLSTANSCEKGEYIVVGTLKKESFGLTLSQTKKQGDEFVGILTGETTWLHSGLLLKENKIEFSSGNKPV